jgi:hypothetical protein
MGAKVVARTARLLEHPAHPWVWFAGRIVKETWKVEVKNASKVVGRRITLHLLSAGLAAGGLLVLAGCKGNTSQGGAGGTGANCTSLIDEPARTLRKTLQYNDKAVAPEKNCAACLQYDEQKYVAQSCGGGCKLFAGPVNPAGGCLSFAPKTPAAGSTKPT